MVITKLSPLSTRVVGRSKIRTSLQVLTSPGARCMTSNSAAPATVYPQDLFKGQTVFITGGGSGINLGVAKGYARVGANLAICGRTQEKLDQASKELQELGAKVFTATADVRDYPRMEEVMEEAQKAFGSIDVVVAGAAGNFLAPISKVSANGFKTVVDIDLLGSYNTAKAALPHLQASKGSIIFISAGQGHIPYYAQAPAGAAKAGIENLMRNLAVEWGPYGIRSNSVVPGPIDGTEGMKKLGPQTGDLVKQFKRSIPLQRYGSFQDVANATIFLSSPLAEYITGTSLFVDGGQNLEGSGFFRYIMEEQAKSKKN